jgi:SAM-dependent methyltransferase
VPPALAGMNIEGMRDLSDRLARERDCFDNLIVKGSKVRWLLHRFSVGFYDKSSRGRLWAPIWATTDLKKAAVLDYGCGDGTFSWILSSLGAHVCGIDISPDSIRHARKVGPQSQSNGSSPRFLVCDAHQTPFKNHLFDYVVGNGALHHLDLDRAFAEIARVLKPGGKAYFMEPMYHHPLLWSLRRLTPKSHTPDEKPLSLSDMEKAKKWFRICSHREHFLFSVCAAPAHLLGKGFALSVIARLDQLDQWVMRSRPRLREFAWLTMLEMEK